MKNTFIQKSKDHRRVNMGGCVLVAHQAEFLPWLGFLSKAAMGDVYFILDTAQFSKDYFENRNKIRTHSNDGWQWLNIPVKGKKHLPRLIDVELESLAWKRKHLNSIKLAYGRAPFFDKYFPEIQKIIENFDGTKLVEYNCQLIEFAFRCFKINIPVFRTSQLVRNGYPLTGKATEFVINMCRIVNADVFIAGIDGKEYLNRERFKEENIILIFQQFSHPIYPQIHGDFLPNMSFIDLLFNCGEDSIKILNKSQYEK